MADVLNPEQIESNPLNTELETPTLEAAADHADSSIETTTLNLEAPTEETASVATESTEELDFGSMEDFAAALESFTGSKRQKQRRRLSTTRQLLQEP